MAPREGLTLAAQAESASLVLRAESFTGAFCPLGFSPSMGIFKKIGSEGGARTLDLAVNSRLLHH